MGLHWLTRKRTQILVGREGGSGRRSWGSRGVWSKYTVQSSQRIKKTKPENLQCPIYTLMLTYEKTFIAIFLKLGKDINSHIMLT